MEHTQEHAENEPKSKDLIKKINRVILWKIAVIPCEIAGLDGTKTTDCREKTKKKLDVVEITNT